MDSILYSIKKMLGSNIEQDCDHFDQDIIIHINSALSILAQLGVGPKTGIRITGPVETWSMLIGDRTDLDDVKDYVYMKVKLIFDPPTSSAVLQSMTNLVNEFEWRINVAAESKTENTD